MSSLVSLPPLIPGVKGSLYRRDDPNAEDADDRFAQLRMRIVGRDNFTCHYCGLMTRGNPDAAPSSLEASGGLQMHHIDDDHTRNVPENLVTVCPLCHMMHHIGFAAHREMCSFIYLPGMRQEDLNILVHCLAVIHTRGNAAMAEQASEMFASLNSLAQADDFLRTLNADPRNVGSALAVLLRETPRAYAARDRAFQGVRVLFDWRKMDLKMFEPMPGWIPGETWLTAWEKIYQDWRHAG